MKYELVHDDTIDFAGYTFARIRALRNIKQHNINTGDLGGYVESKYDLSQEGEDWLHAGGTLCNGIYFPEELLRSFEMIKKHVSDACVRRGDKEDIVHALKTAMSRILDMHTYANKRESQK